MRKSPLSHLLDRCLSPKLRAHEPLVRLYQARFSVVVSAVVTLFAIGRVILSSNSIHQGYFLIVAGFSSLALLGYRFLSRPDLVLFIWMLSLVTLETVSGFYSPTLYIMFFAWLPLSIGLTIYLAGVKLGAVFTILALGQALWTIKYSGLHASRAPVLDPAILVRDLQLNLLAAEIVAGLVIYWIGLIREQSENELEQRRIARSKTERINTVREMVGQLAHELNNPLAIIHSCVVQYKNELSAGSPTVERQLFFRQCIDDARSRIHRVSLAMSEYAEDSLEKTGSADFLGHCLEAKEKASSSALALDGTIEWQERLSLTRFRPRITKFSSRLLGFFLPPAMNSTSTSSRSLIAVGTILLATIFEIGNVTNFVFVPPTPVILWSNVGLLLISLLSLTAMRIGFEPGKVVPFFSSGYIVVLAYVSSRCQCFMAPGMYYFPVFLMFGSLLSRSRWANIQSITAIFATLYVFAQTSDYGLAIPWGWEVDVFLRRMSVVTIIMCVVSFLTMALQDFYRKQTNDEIKREREWLFRSSRHLEVSTISGSFYARLHSPVLDLGRAIERLKAIEPMNTVRELSLQNLDHIGRSVDVLSKIMRAIHLTHPVNGQSLETTITVTRLFEHLTILLNDKARDEGWDLCFQSVIDSEDGQEQAEMRTVIEGALSSLAILITTLVLRNFELYHVASAPKLVVRSMVSKDPKDRRVSWSISWPKLRLKASLVPNLLEDRYTLLSSELHERFIEDLLKECGGDLSRRFGLETEELVLRGDWFRV